MSSQPNQSSNQQTGTTVTQPTYLDEPGYNLPSRDQLHTIACRLIHQTRGTVAGITPDGKRTGKSWHRGTLSLEEAVFSVQYALSRGLNPFGDIHIWWYRQLQVTEHYRILAGWANLRQPYTGTYRPIEDADNRQRHGLQEGDIGAACYILKAADRELFLGCLAAGMTRWEALATAGTSAVGIVYQQEMTDSEGQPKQIDVKGWSWLQRAETRALRNALGRSHGTPTPAEIIFYAQRLNPGLTPAALASPAFDPDLSPDLQRRYLELTAQSEQRRQRDAHLTPEQRRRRFEETVELLRGEEEEGID